TLKIAVAWPKIGVWGGQLIPEFEQTPPESLRPYLTLAAVGECSDDRWSNQYTDSAIPCGAGMCLRRVVAEHFSKLIAADPQRRSLDRKGASLISGGDTDIALT